jgi:diguanylate cyclase (GGDEF)-like protein
MSSSTQAPIVWVVATQYLMYLLGWVLCAAFLKDKRAALLHWAVFNVCMAIAFALIAQRDETRTWWAYGGANLLFIAGLLCLRRGLNDFFQRPQPDTENLAVFLLACAAFAWLGSTAQAGPWRVVAVYTADAYIIGRMLMDTRHAVLAEFGRRALWLLFIPAGLMLANCILHVLRQLLDMGHALELHRVSLQAYGALASFLVVGAVFNMGFTGLLIMRLVRRLQDQSVRDALTGLHNRRALDEQLQRVWQHWQRAKLPYAVLLLDIDHFKRINDEKGHAAGDQVLVEAAGRVQAEARAVDTVARLGGEEFLVLMPHTDREGASVAAERLLKRLTNEPMHAGGELLTVTVSVGVACVVDGDTNTGATLARADRAMYQAKQAGRNRVAVAGHNP